MSPAFGADDYAAGQRHNLAFLQPVGRARRVPVVDAARRRTVREGRRRAAHRGAQAARRAVEGRPHHAPVSALLALRHAAALLRAHVVVRPHDGVPRRDAGAQRARRLASAVGRRGAVRRVAARTTSTGRSRATATGARRCRSGCATATPTHVECIGGYAELAERVGRAAAARLRSAQAERRSLHVAVLARPDAAGRCAARPRSSTPGSTRARCRSRSGTIRSRTATRSPSSSRRISSPRASTRRAGGSTRCWRSRRGSVTRCRTTRASGGANTFADVASPYRAVVVNDIVLDAEGQEDVEELRQRRRPVGVVIARHGADAVRLFLVASSEVWVPRSFDESVLAEQAGRFLRTLKNVYSGIFAQYANFGWSPSDADPALADAPADRSLDDRAARDGSSATVDAALERVRRDGRGARDHRVRRRRRRELVRAAEPRAVLRRRRRRQPRGVRDAARGAGRPCAGCSRRFAPFVSDWMHRELTGESVHLAPFVAHDAVARRTPTLERAMAAIRTLATARARGARGGRHQGAPAAWRGWCASRPSVQRSGAWSRSSRCSPRSSTSSGSSSRRPATRSSRCEAKPNFRSLGKKFGKKTPLAAQAVAAFDQRAAARVRAWRAAGR